MCSLRAELTDAQWKRLEGLLPGRAGAVGRPGLDNRRFVNGVLWVLRSGMRWSDMPERYGPYKTVHKRFVRWARAGVWDLIFTDLVGDRKNPNLMIDSTIVRAHQQAAAGRKKGSEDPALGRSRGGLSTKILLLADGQGAPLAFRLTPGQAGEQPQALPLLEGRQAEAVIADRGYDADAILNALAQRGIQAVIPPRTMRKVQRSFDRTLYKTPTASNAALPN